MKILGAAIAMIRHTNIKMLVSASLLLCSTGVTGNELVDAETGLANISTRYFSVLADIEEQRTEVEGGRLHLSAVDWIDEYLDSNALLAGTIVRLRDGSILSDEVYWKPDHLSDYQAVEGLDPQFIENGYLPLWDSNLDVPNRTRGTILFVPTQSDAWFYFVCTMYDSVIDFSLPCSIVQRYSNDDHIFIHTLVWRPSERWTDFDRLAEEIDRLVECLDATDSFKGSEGLLNARTRDALLIQLDDRERCGPPQLL